MLTKKRRIHLSLLLVFALCASIFSTTINANDSFAKEKADVNGTSGNEKSLKITDASNTASVVSNSDIPNSSTASPETGSVESAKTTIDPSASPVSSLDPSGSPAASLKPSGSPSASNKPSASPGASNKPKASSTPVPAPKFSSFVINKNKALEKKKSFQISIKGLKYSKGVTGITFKIYNSKGKKIYTKKGTSQNTKNTSFIADVSFKKLGYVFDTYTVKGYVTPTKGKERALPDVAIADMKVSGGTLRIIKNSNATTTFELSNAYIPGNIKSAEFKVYKQNGTKNKKTSTLIVNKTAEKSQIKCTTNNVGTGKYSVKIYGYTTWKKKVLLKESNYTISKKNMGKNGWVYEKYNGKKYKFYYIDNVKQTDLTKVLNLKKSGGSNTNNFYIEVNRAACTVTIYAKNSETGKYDIPVKTCTVCVGRDTSTAAGAGSLSLHSSFTPIGTYSICSNGTSAKYSLKPMHEPDGSVCYARWASHIVGNVYFHSIAVGAASHNALPSYRFNLLGSPASAGCIRMAVADAKWIYDYASTGSTVKIVVGSSKKPGPLGKIAMPKSNGVNYDPTDPAISNAQKKKDYAAKRITGYMMKNGKKVGY